MKKNVDPFHTFDFLLFSLNFVDTNHSSEYFENEAKDSISFNILYRIETNICHVNRALKN